MLNRRLFWIFILVLAAVFPPNQRPQAQASEPAVVVLRFEGALHPVMLEHLERAFQAAEREGASAIVLELNTPGGSILLMNELVQDIRGSQVPVIVYVSPRGAMAASAGTLITLAGHLSAMAPETTIGAASPVGSQGEDIGETSEAKEKEVLKATVRTLAASRPKQAISLAEEMIQDARAVSVDEAVEIGLVDYKVASLKDLLNLVDGKTVRVQEQTVILHTAGARQVNVGRTFMEDLLTVLANPNIAFLLLAIGVQAILIEISSPGGWVAGFIGVVCLLLAVYGMGLLPVNWFGILFMLVAFVLFLLDIKAATHGALTAAGVGSFIAGALILFNSPNVPAFQRVSVPLVIGTGVFIAATFFGAVTLALRAQSAPLLTGHQTLVGKVGLIKAAVNPKGQIQVAGELWTARLVEGEAPLQIGERAEVAALEGVIVYVKKAKPQE